VAVPGSANPRIGAQGRESTRPAGTLEESRPVPAPVHAAASEPAGPASDRARIAVIKQRMLWCLAILWLIDTALQAQPVMFSYDIVSTIMTPSLGTNPIFLNSLDQWAINLVTPDIVAWNCGFIAIQGMVAVALLWGLLGRKRSLIRFGLWLSIFWGIVVWIVGEGTGGVFTGQGTMLTGAPGAVLLYLLIATFLLLPDRQWNLDGRFCAPRDTLAIIFFYGFLAQVLTPVYWSDGALSELIQGQVGMAPPWMDSTLRPAVSLTAHSPQLWNAGLGLALLMAGILLWGRRPRLAGFVWLGIVLAVIWYWGEAMGGIFDGMGTDPNSAPLLALLALPAWAVWRARREQAGIASSEPAAV